MKIIVILSPQKRHLISCKKLNIKVIAVDTKDKIGTLKNKNIIKKIYCNPHDVNTLKKTLFKLKSDLNFSSVLAFNEKYQYSAVYLNEKLKTKVGISMNVFKKINNKLKMRNFLKKTSFSPLVYKKIDNFKSLKLFLHKKKGDFILKPINGTGSKNIFMVNSCDDLKKFKDIFNKNSSEWIIEQFIQGEEYSVEAFSYNSKHKIVAITKKYINEDFIEYQHISNPVLNEDIKNKIHKYIKRFLSLMNINNGPSHTEIICTKSDIYIIETHNRIGGDRISYLSELTSGFSLTKATLELYSNSFSYKNTYYSTFKHTAIIFFYPDKSGILEHFELNCDYKKDVQVITFDLDLKEPLKVPKESFDRKIYVILGSNDYKNLLKYLNNFDLNMKIT